MTIAIKQRTSGFWLQKLQEQIATVRKKQQTELLERVFALDIALAYLFLYLFLEATIDQIVLNILTFHRARSQALHRKRKHGRYLRDKLEFIFTEFCPQLPFKEFSNLKQSIRPLSEIRNRIVHLEELSWSVSLEENQKPEEKPTRTTEYLTVESLRQHYYKVRDILAGLAKTLDRGLQSAKIRGKYGEERKAKARNLIEFVYEISVLPLKDFEEII